MIAYAIDVEALGTTAALGAFFAPILLGRDQGNPELLLLYLASMAAGLGLVAARRRWRLTMFVVALSYFGVAYTGAADRGPPWGLLLYGVVGGTIGIHVGLRERWWETRFLSFGGGWAFLAAASSHLPHRWAILAGGSCWPPRSGGTRCAPPRSCRCTCHPRREFPAGRWAKRSTFSSPRSSSGGRFDHLAPVWFDQRPGLVASSSLRSRT